MNRLLTTLVMGCHLLTTWPKLCRGTVVLDKTLMANYQPDVGEMWHGGKRVLSPDTPYAAACAQNAIYFIDQRFDPESAGHIKEQLEHLVPDENGYWFIDEVEATAERRDATGKTLFTFNPAYARVFFADSMNRRNPSLKLPVHEPAGEWLVVYDVDNVMIGDKAKSIGTGLTPRDRMARSFFEKRDDCEDYGCQTDDDCKNKDKKCDSCDIGRVDNNCRDGGLVNAVGRCLSGSPGSCKAAVDTPRLEGETDADYYQRMDKLHWG